MCSVVVGLDLPRRRLFARGQEHGWHRGAWAAVDRDAGTALTVSGVSRLAPRIPESRSAGRLAPVDACALDVRGHRSNSTLGRYLGGIIEAAATRAAQRLTREPCG